LVLRATPLSFFYHLAAGMRHLAFDAGRKLNRAGQHDGHRAIVFAAGGDGGGLVRGVCDRWRCDDLLPHDLSRARGLGSAGTRRQPTGFRAHHRRRTWFPLGLWGVYSVLNLATSATRARSTGCSRP
jgi:hypothetical protein